MHTFKFKDFINQPTYLINLDLEIKLRCNLKTSMKNKIKLKSLLMKIKFKLMGRMMVSKNFWKYEEHGDEYAFLSNRIRERKRRKWIARVCF